MKLLCCALLLAAGLTAFAAAEEYRNDVQILLYETNTEIEKDPNSPLSFFKDRTKVAGIPATVFGGNTEFRGFGDKYSTLRPLLEISDPDKIVILADARDVALNVPDNSDQAKAAVDRFTTSFEKLTKNAPNAVVVSAEAQCCVSAMSNAFPNEYFDADTGVRTKRACVSGQQGCEWEDNEKIAAWDYFMNQRAVERTGSEGQEDVYLNAGLMAGYPEDLIALLDMMDIGPTEDDQAVLSGLFYSFPNKIVLDYGQEMFGNNQWPRGLDEGCVFEPQNESGDLPLKHTVQNTMPLILHTPGKFYSCLDKLIDQLGGNSQKRYIEATEPIHFTESKSLPLAEEGHTERVDRELKSKSDKTDSQKCACYCDTENEDGRRQLRVLQVECDSAESLNCAQTCADTNLDSKLWDVEGDTAAQSGGIPLATAAPSAIPSAAPSSFPSSAPSDMPSVEPSAAPSDAPTSSPTMSPVAEGSSQYGGYGNYGSYGNYGGNYPPNYASNYNYPPAGYGNYQYGYGGVSLRKLLRAHFEQPRAIPNAEDRKLLTAARANKDKLGPDYEDLTSTGAPTTETPIVTEPPTEEATEPSTEAAQPAPDNYGYGNYGGNYPPNYPPNYGYPPAGYGNYSPNQYGRKRSLRRRVRGH